MIRFIISILLTTLFFMTMSGQINEGTASFYHDKFDGQPTASGEIYDKNELTAAHRELPFGTMLKVTNLGNKKNIIVKVNDRGPFVKDRLIDLSRSAAEVLGFIDQGMANVKIEVIKSGNEKLAITNTSEIKKQDSDVRFPNEYYELDIKFSKPTGFAVQVGSFTELANLLRMAQELRRSYGKNLLVQVTDVDEKKVHRLLVGPFVDRASAEKMQQTLKDGFSGAFVLELK
jgi:rare lipoprotein A